MAHTIHELAEDIRRQVKKHREMRRKRAQTRPCRMRAASRSLRRRSSPAGEAATGSPPHRYP